MNEFNDIIAGWKGQAVPSPRSNASELKQIATVRMQSARRKQLLTILILSLTLAVVAAFAFTFGAGNMQFVLGVGIMIFALAVRIGVELFSMRQLQRLDITSNAVSFLEDLRRLYVSRKRIHGFFTYAIFGLYVAGFCLLLPIFKATLSGGFFLYIIVSGVIIFAGLIIFIYRKTREELREIGGVIDDLQNLEGLLTKTI